MGWFVGLLVLLVPLMGLCLWLRYRQTVLLPSLVQAPHITPDEPHLLWGSVASLKKRTGSMCNYAHAYQMYLQNPQNKVVRMHILFDVGVVVYDINLVRRVMITENYPKSSFYTAFADLFGDGLVSSEGIKWEHHRKLLNPAFGPLYLKNLVGAFVDHTRTLIEELNKHGDVEDLGEELQKLAMDIIAKTGFGFSLHSVEGKAPPVQRSVGLLLRLVSQPAVILLSFYRKLIKLKHWSDIKLIDHVIFGSIEEKRKRKGDTQNKRPDILDLLLSPSEENKNERQLTNEEIKDELMTFFVAGHETTALTLTWAIYELHRNPEVMERLVKEVDEILLDPTNPKAGPREPRNEDMPRFKYLTMILKETLRLYPPASGLTRQTPEDVEFNGHKVAKGVTVFLPIYAIQRDPEFWKNPDQFDPERWNEDNIAESSQRFFAFSHGPRNCIGQQFFWMEAKVILPMILSRFKVVVENKEDVMATDKTGTLKPVVPIRTRFIKREY